MLTNYRSFLLIWLNSLIFCEIRITILFVAFIRQHALSLFELLVTWSVAIFLLECHFLSAFILFCCLQLRFTLSKGTLSWMLAGHVVWAWMISGKLALNNVCLICLELGMGIGYGCIASIEVLRVLKDCGCGLLMAVFGYSNDLMLRLIVVLSFINWTIIQLTSLCRGTVI